MSSKTLALLFGRQVLLTCVPDWRSEEVLVVLNTGRSLHGIFVLLGISQLLEWLVGTWGTA